MLPSSAIVEGVANLHSLLEGQTKPGLVQRDDGESLLASARPAPVGAPEFAMTLADQDVGQEFKAVAKPKPTALCTI